VRAAGERQPSPLALERLGTLLQVQQRGRAVVYVKFCKLLAVMRLEVRIMRPRGARVSSAP
jgi:hypothetical protein